MDRPVALAAAKTDGETSPNVAGSSRGYFELLPDEGTDGGGGSRQRQHQSSAPPWPRLSRHELSAAEGATLGRHKDRIRRFSESRVVCALLHIVVQNREKKLGELLIEGSDRDCETFVTGGSFVGKHTASGARLSLSIEVENGDSPG